MASAVPLPDRASGDLERNTDRVDEAVIGHVQIWLECIHGIDIIVHDDSE